MKNTFFLFTTMLILWVTGCTYFYVCRVRNDCRVDNRAVEAAFAGQKTDTLASPVVQNEPPALLVVYFDFGKLTAVLTEEDEFQLELFRKYLDDNPGARVIVSGHSDNIGSQQVKLKVSSARAAFARQKLLDAGIDVARIDYTGKGDSEPAGDNSTAEGLAKNRRAEILIK